MASRALTGTRGGSRSRWSLKPLLGLGERILALASVPCDSWPSLQPLPANSHTPWLMWAAAVAGTTSQALLARGRPPHAWAWDGAVAKLLLLCLRGFLRGEGHSPLAHCCRPLCGWSYPKSLRKTGERERRRHGGRWGWKACLGLPSVWPGEQPSQLLSRKCLCGSEHSAGCSGPRGSAGTSWGPGCFLGVLTANNKFHSFQPVYILFFLMVWSGTFKSTWNYIGGRNNTNILFLISLGMLVKFYY